MRPCISIRGFVRWSVSWSVGPSVRRLVRWSVGPTRVFLMVENAQTMNNELTLGPKLIIRHQQCFLGSGGFPWGHGWMTQPRGLRMGWADAEKLGFVQM